MLSKGCFSPWYCLSHYIFITQRSPESLIIFTSPHGWSSWVKLTPGRHNLNISSFNKYWSRCCQSNQCYLILYRNLSIVSKFEHSSSPFDLSIIEHNSQIFGHYDSINVIMVQNLINTLVQIADITIQLRIVKLKHCSHFNVVLKCRLLKLIQLRIVKLKHCFHFSVVLRCRLLTLIQLRIFKFKHCSHFSVVLKCRLLTLCKTSLQKNTTLSTDAGWA